MNTWYWKRRKAEWLGLGIRSGEGRGSNVKPTTVASGWINRGPAEGGSIFDPVLCECVYKWFCPKGGHVLDPFAGGSVRGIVATHPEVGLRYTGVELRAEQVDANRRQAAEIGVTPQWIIGDSANLSSLLPPDEQYDLVFTCPPYFDLEVYSESTADGSSKRDYDEFLSWYEDIFFQALNRLRPRRFAVIVVGDLRDKESKVYELLRFPSHTVLTMKGLGCLSWRRFVLKMPMGSAAIRMQRQWATNRIPVNLHQDVLVFYNDWGGSKPTDWDWTNWYIPGA